MLSIVIKTFQIVKNNEVFKTYKNLHRGWYIFHIDNFELCRELKLFFIYLNRKIYIMSHWSHIILLTNTMISFCSKGTLFINTKMSHFFTNHTGNMHAQKTNKAQTKRARITVIQYSPGIWYCLCPHQKKWCQTYLIVYLIFVLIPQKLHQLTLFASSMIWRTLPLLWPAASPLWSEPPSMQRLTYLFQSRRIYGNTRLLHSGLPLHACEISNILLLWKKNVHTRIEMSVGSYTRTFLR